MNLFIFMHCSQTTPFILAYRFGHPQYNSVSSSADNLYGWKHNGN
jgi:hypothetical protein